MGVRVHGLRARLDVLDEAEPERPATILIALELSNGCLSGVGVVETNDASATRTPTRLVLDLGLLDFSNGREQLDEILVAGGPGKL